jgi:hypothetical protein
MRPAKPSRSSGKWWAKKLTTADSSADRERISRHDIIETGVQFGTVNPGIGGRMACCAIVAEVEKTAAVNGNGTGLVYQF